MTVRELQAILAEWHPDEEVCLFSASRKHMVLLGFNRIESEASKCCVIDCDWSRHDMPKESESDRLRRERDALDEQTATLAREREELNRRIERAYKEEYKKNGPKKKARKKAKAKMTAVRKELTGEQATEPKKRGRPRKTDQLPDQSSEK